MRNAAAPPVRPPFRPMPGETSHPNAGTPERPVQKPIKIRTQESIGDAADGPGRRPRQYPTESGRTRQAGRRGITGREEET